jgi:lysophospholipase L1-like esterase
MRLRRWLARLGLLVGSVGLSVVVLELAIRVLAPQPTVLLRPDIWEPDHQGLGHHLAPGLDTVVNTGERDVRLRTDAEGHRIAAEGEPPEARVRVLALGDSFLEALAIPYEETVTARLEAALARGLDEPVHVVNAGVSASSPNRYLRAARLELEHGHWDAVLVFLFEGNDLIARRRDWIPPRASRAETALRWPATLERRELVAALVHPLYTQLRTRSQLVVWLKRRLLPVLVRLGFTDHAFPPHLLRAAADAPYWQVTAEVCADIAAVARAHGAEPLVVLLPADYQVDRELGLAFAASASHRAEEIDLGQPARRLRDELERRGVPVLDAAPALERAFGAGTAVYGRVDRHLDAAGHRVLAEAVLPRLRERLEPR